MFNETESDRERVMTHIDEETVEEYEAWLANDGEDGEFEEEDEFISEIEWDFWSDEELQDMLQEGWRESEFSMDARFDWDELDDENADIEEAYDELEDELHAKADKRAKKKENMPMDGRGLVTNNVNRKFKQERKAKDDEHLL